MMVSQNSKRTCERVTSHALRVTGTAPGRVLDDELGHLVQVVLRQVVFVDKGLGGLVGLLGAVVGELEDDALVDVDVEDVVVLLALEQGLAPGAGCLARLVGLTHHVTDLGPLLVT